MSLARCDHSKKCECEMTMELGLPIVTNAVRKVCSGTMDALHLEDVVGHRLYAVSLDPRVNDLRLILQDQTPFALRILSEEFDKVLASPSRYVL